MEISPVNHVDLIRTPLSVAATTGDETVPSNLQSSRLIDVLKILAMLPETMLCYLGIPMNAKTCSIARSRSARGILSRAAAVLILVWGAASLAWAQEPYSRLRATGPLTLAIAYRCNPDQRVALRQKMLAGGVARFEEWKKQAVLVDYHILFNSYLDSETYDMVSVLTFKAYSDIARWRETERESPGGLNHDVLSLITSAVTYPLDAIRHNAARDLPERGRSAYFIIPYDYLIPTDDYVTYLDAYVIPQVNGWIGENILAGYTIYLGRYPTSRPWSSLFVLEYRDADAFGKREATIAKIRERLKSNPTWLAASESKHKVRIEKQTIIAEELIAR